jgi:hypothetical protein
MKASSWLVIALAVVVLLGWASTGFGKSRITSRSLTSFTVLPAE